MSESIQLVIGDVAYGGDGVGRHEGQVVFVPGTLPGETVAVDINESRRHYARARLKAVITASPDRVEPECPYATRPFLARPAQSPFCVGCAYHHCTYEREVELKQKQLMALMSRQMSLDEQKISSPHSSPLALGYRNKIILHAAVDGNVCHMGYIQEDNQTVLDIEACPLAMASINSLLNERRNHPGFFKTLRDGMVVAFRASQADGAVWWRGEASDKAGWMKEATVIGTLLVPRTSFSQVNPAVADALMNWVMERMRSIGVTKVADLYCGVGGFAMSALHCGAREIIGIESDVAAISAARINAQNLFPAIENNDARWSAGDVFREWSKFCKRQEKMPDAIIVDPPRSGLDGAVVDLFVQHPSPHLLYISCGPDTLARDLKRLTDACYEIVEMKLFDMFPRTAHFEVAVHLIQR